MYGRNWHFLDPLTLMYAFCIGKNGNFYIKCTLLVWPSPLGGYTLHGWPLIQNMEDKKCKETGMKYNITTGNNIFSLKQQICYRLTILQLLPFAENHIWDKNNILGLFRSVEVKGISLVGYYQINLAIITWGEGQIFKQLLKFRGVGNII